MSSTSALNSLLSSSSTSSSGIDLSSLLTAATGSTSTGIDVTSAVDAALYAARAPERQWQTQQSTIQSQLTALSSVQSALSALSTDLNSLNDPGGVLASRTVSSSNTSVVSATASAGAVSGTHSIQVQSLATSASWYSSPLTSSSSSVGSSQLQITTAQGSQTSFQLGSGGLTSLSAVAQAINSASLGVTASVVTDAIGSRLALVSQNAGAAANFTVADVTSSGSQWNSASLPRASATLDAGQIQVSDGNASASISIAAGSTLSDVANQINAAGLNLSASVVSDSSGTHLAVAAGTGANVSVSSDPALTLTQPTVGADASLTVDGVPVKSASNTVSGAISGVTLQLQGVGGGTPTNLAVSADTTQISSAVSQFVSDYNSSIQLVNSQFTYSASTNSQGVLGSDTAVRSLQNALLGVVGYVSPSSTSNSNTLSSLSALGISVKDDGTLTLSSTKLSAALSTNPDGVQQFFQGTALNGFASTVSNKLTAFTSPSSGILTADVKSLNQQYSDLQTQVSNYESGYIASQQTLLTAMYSKAEIALEQLPTTLKQLQAEFSTGSSGS